MSTKTSKSHISERSNPLLVYQRGRVEKLLTFTGLTGAHTASCAFFALIILAWSGLALFFWYPASFQASYEALSQWPDQNQAAHFSRSLHRHAAHLMALLAGLHLLRVALTRRSAAPGLLSVWLSGGFLLLFILWQGLTGLILPMDRESREIMGALAVFLPQDNEIVARLTGAGEISDQAAIYLLAAHLIPPFVAIGFLYIHLGKLARPRFWPTVERGAGLVAGLIAAAILFPALTGYRADFTRWGDPVSFDPLFMAAIAPLTVLTPVHFAEALVSLLTLMFGLLFLLSRRRIAPAVTLDSSRCVGCALCAIDCPYTAIQMVDAPGRPHPRLAYIDKDRCPGCAVCVGSCPFDALYLPGRQGAFCSSGDAAPQTLYVCSSRPDYQAIWEGVEENESIDLIPLACAGELFAGHVELAYKRGTATVSLYCCSPGECHSRFGARYAHERLFHQRRPWLRPSKRRGSLLLSSASRVNLHSLKQEENDSPAGPSLRDQSKEMIGKKLAIFCAVALLTLLGVASVRAVEERASITFSGGHTPHLALFVTLYQRATLTITIDNETREKFALEPGDGLEMAYVSRVYTLPTGQRRVAVALKTEGGDSFSLAQQVDIGPGRVVYLRFDGVSGEWLVDGEGE